MMSSFMTLIEKIDVFYYGVGDDTLSRILLIFSEIFKIKPVSVKTTGRPATDHPPMLFVHSRIIITTIHITRSKCGLIKSNLVDFNTISC